MGIGTNGEWCICRGESRPSFVFPFCWKNTGNRRISWSLYGWRFHDAVLQTTTEQANHVERYRRGGSRIAQKPYVDVVRMIFLEILLAVLLNRDLCS